jgi:tripartite-type tricarboxylate transporter receptor subunit TctC
MAQGVCPERPSTMIVRAAAGGPSDTVGRLVAEGMSADLGERVIIENVGGAGGSLGAGQVAKAAPDGYTLLLYHIAVATFAPLYPNLTYKPEEFESVGLVTEVPLTIVGRKDLPPSDMAGLIDWLKGKGGGATFGTAGVGAASDLCGRLLSDATGIKLTAVAYRGTGPAMNDLVGGQIDVMCDQTTNTTKQIKGATIKAYAVTSQKRLDALPDVPTTDEGGLAGMQIGIWQGIYAPKGTAPEITERLSKSLQVALKDPNVTARFAELFSGVWEPLY